MHAPPVLTFPFLLLFAVLLEFFHLFNHREELQIRRIRRKVDRPKRKGQQPHPKAENKLRTTHSHTTTTLTMSLPSPSTTSPSPNKPTVILFYKYVTLPDPQSIAQWQTDLCTQLRLTGKIVLANEGINATLAADDQTQTDAYISQMRAHALFFDIDFKQSIGRGAHVDFEHGLSVRVANEIITTRFDRHGRDDEWKQVPNGTYLSPQEFHEALIREKLVVSTSDKTCVEKNDGNTSEVENEVNKDNSSGGACLLDVRNFYESRIGHFENAICPPVRANSQFGEYIDENLDLFRNKKVFCYCTGGIRCERFTSYLRYKGIDQVYQLHGGIHRYIEQFPDGFFRGKNYVFDERGYVKANDDVLTKCDVCKVVPHDIYRFCSSEGCKTIVIACDACLEKTGGKVYCCAECEQYGWKYMKVMKQKEHEKRMEQMRVAAEEKKRRRRAEKLRQRQQAEQERHQTTISPRIVKSVEEDDDVVDLGPVLLDE